MTEFRNIVFNEDCLTGLRKLPENSVDTVVTSPPYWKARNYNVPPTKWPECNLALMFDFPSITIPAMTCCLGHEKTPHQFVAHMVLIFEEVRRVLKPWGTCWLNMGDCYIDNQKRVKGMKRTDMVGIPWELAFALRTDGWWLRSDIIWYKKNGNPESAKSRPTKAHEYFFLLSKTDKYYYDCDAIREMPNLESLKRAKRARSANHKMIKGAPGQPPHSYHREKTNENINKPRPNLNEIRTANEALAAGTGIHSIGANKRTVWEVATASLSLDHFATYPEKLIGPCIKAGASIHGNCAECGKPYTRIVERNLVETYGVAKTLVVDDRDLNADKNDQGSNRTKDGHIPGMITEVITKGWKKPCTCKTKEIVRPIVLDPFAGAGTTMLVAKAHGCDYTGFEIGAQYMAQQKERLEKEFGVFAL